ncbi:MAG: HU family DNA-binding protein [Phycisphaerales bacterium]|nr:MAG: HU family DNA-binding protein [Phycisphaerales bacterium]
MNKGELIRAVQIDLKVSRAEATRAVESVVSAIREGIKRDTSVTISGFGTFSRRKRSARTVLNPGTGEPVEVKESLTVGFKPSQLLKDEL